VVQSSIHLNGSLDAVPENLTNPRTNAPQFGATSAALNFLWKRIPFFKRIGREGKQLLEGPQETCLSKTKHQDEESLTFKNAMTILPENN
jgi:hypothetical protein